MSDKVAVELLKLARELVGLSPAMVRKLNPHHMKIEARVDDGYFIDVKLTYDAQDELEAFLEQYYRTWYEGPWLHDEIDRKASKTFEKSLGKAMKKALADIMKPVLNLADEWDFSNPKIYVHRSMEEDDAEVWMGFKIYDEENFERAINYLKKRGVKVS